MPVNRIYDADRHPHLRSPQTPAKRYLSGSGLRFNRAFLGALITVFYGLYFLFICGYNLSFYSAFVSSVMAPKFSLLLLASAVLLTACYGAFRGVEALARASGIIIVIVVACLVFFITALLFKLDPLNYTPLLYDGTDKMWIGVEQMIGRSSCIVFLGMLLPFTRGKVKKGFLPGCSPPTLQ